MRRWIAIVGLLACFGLEPTLEARGAKRYLNKETTADMSAMNNILLGWVDMAPDDWAVHEYSSKEEWAGVIDVLNNSFQRLCATKWLPGRTVTGAKDKAGENAAGKDLYIKFADVRIDYDNYLLYLSIHFIDPKTNTEIGAIPARAYYGNDWGFAKYLKAALEEVNRKIQVEVAGAAATK